MQYDKHWEELYFPDFSPYQSLDPKKGINLVSADPFAPDCELPEAVVKAYQDVIVEGRGLHYAEGNGDAALHQTIQKKLKEFNGIEVDTEKELLITAGSAFGLYLSIRMCICPNRGDEVINFDPTFAENINDVKVMGAKNVFCSVYPEDDFQVRRENLEKCITENTRVIIVTNPGNSTGVVYTRETLEMIAQIACKHDLMVVCDQCFERNVYDGREYVSMVTLPGMRERTLNVFGTSKDYGLSGLRLGYVVGPEKLISMMKIATSNMVGTVPAAAQYAVIAAMENSEYIEKWNERFDRRRKLGYEILNQVPGVVCKLPHGGYFHWVDIHRLGSSQEIVKYLVEEAQVAVGGGHWFGENGEGHIRIMYCRPKSDEIYKIAIERIAEALKKLKVNE